MEAARPALHIEILGINRIGEEPYNSLITEGRTLSWLQDTPEAAVWEHWGVTYRDVRILDPQNRLYSVFNLTLFNLATEANRELLKQRLLNAAKFIDTDKDGLLDDWEMLHFGSLAPEPGDDPDGDGRNNAAEFAFVTDPTHAADPPPVRLLPPAGGADPAWTVVVRRRLGDALAYAVAASRQCVPWVIEPDAIRPAGQVENLYDGTGAGRILYRLEWPEGIAPASHGFVQVGALFNPEP
ncbi:MAG: hypothetical protein Kow001_24870 [Acidobacteriota bacterium]